MLVQSCPPGPIRADRLNQPENLILPVDIKYTLDILSDVSNFDWSEEKNRFHEQTRGVSFEDVIFHIQKGDVLDVIKHPKANQYPEQKIIVINIEGYVHLVPYVKEKGIRFLKTIIPSRKATKEYLE
jgi:uncharacterized DUF497 family protein